MTSIPPPGGTHAQRIRELETDLHECMAGSAQAREICDAVAAALGDDLDRDAGSAESVRRLKELLVKTRQELLVASLQGRPVRYTHASGVTPAERAYAHRTELYKAGDMRLVWVNEGDLLGHKELPAPTDPAPTPTLEDNPLAAEVARLTAALHEANSIAEEYERRYYLETHKVEALEACLAERAANEPPAAYLIEDKLHMTGIIRVRSDEDVELAKAHGPRAVALYKAQVWVTEPDPAEMSQVATDMRIATLREAINVLEAVQVPVGNSAAGEMAAQWTMDTLRDVRAQLQSRIAHAPALATAEWLVAPREPTPEMVEAAENDHTYYGSPAANHWRAMAKVVPAAPYHVKRQLLLGQPAQAPR